MEKNKNMSDIKLQYKRNGFVLLKQIIPLEKVSAIQNDAIEIFSKQIIANGIDLNEQNFEVSLFELFNRNYKAFIGAAKLCQHTIILHSLASEQIIITKLKEIGIEKPAICVKPIIYFNSRHIAKIEGNYKTPTHQDWRSMQGSLNSAVVWIPLIPISKDLGALEVVPGSHKFGLMNSESDEWFRKIKDDRISDDKFISLEVEPGDMVIFSSFLVHKSGNNITENIRWSMHFRYNDIFEETFIKREYPHPYVVYRPDQDLVTPNFPDISELEKIFGN